MNKVIVSLGSNIDPDQHIPQARQFLQQEFNVIKESLFAKTKPVGIVDQPDFINGMVLIETGLSMVDLRQKLKAIELQMGRRPSEDKFVPRVIDLDILIWNGEVVDSDFYRIELYEEQVGSLLPNFKRV
jgi:2-amino-4-hydroxy-6-hydroxymethyldihydropteridine diphosphokinase